MVQGIKHWGSLPVHNLSHTKSRNMGKAHPQLRALCIYCCKCESALRQEPLLPPDYLLSSKNRKPVLSSSPSCNISQLPCHCNFPTFVTEILKVSVKNNLSKYPVHQPPSHTHSLQVGKRKFRKGHYLPFSSLNIY